MRHHRAKYDLLAYAEALADGCVPVSAATARHVAECSVCRTELEAIKRSLETARRLPLRDSSPDLTARILQAATLERRQQMEGRRERRRAIVSGLRGFAAAAGLVLAAALFFPSALGKPAAEPSTLAPVAENRPDAGSSSEDLRRAADAMATLARAVGPQPSEHANLWEVESRRDVIAREGDLRAGLSALERNPGCERANRLVYASVPRQAEALKTLYARQGF